VNAAGRRRRAPLAVAALLLALAAPGTGCADSSSSGASGPQVVSVLGRGAERATGFTVAAGRVVTVAHAVEGGGPIRVRVRRAAARSARVLRLDRRTDVALLAVPGLRGRAPGTATTDGDVRVRVLALRGGRVVAVPGSVRRAIDARVSAPGSRRALHRPALELEARLGAGDSGAPVLTSEGKLAGVLFARSRNRADTAYAVDAVAVERLVDGAPR
jgi:S1-C subfamily serine protease